MMAIVIVSLIGSFGDEKWLRFVAYAAASAIPLLAWKRSIGFTLSLSVALLGVVLEFHNPLMNLFGVAAGILLAMNLKMLRKIT